MDSKKKVNWDEFNKVKVDSNSDTRYFSFKDWEIEFLVNEISSNHPEYDEIEILRAILACCESVQSPNLKLDFCQCVLDELKNP